MTLNIPRIVMSVEGRPVNLDGRWLTVRHDYPYDWSVWAVKGGVTRKREWSAGAIVDCLHRGTEQECAFYVNFIQQHDILDNVDVAKLCRIPSTKGRLLLN